MLQSLITRNFYTAPTSTLTATLTAPLSARMAVVLTFTDGGVIYALTFTDDTTETVLTI